MERRFNERDVGMMFEELRVLVILGLMILVIVGWLRGWFRLPVPGSVMLNCPKCGVETSASGKRCQVCGKELVG